ncbi:MAG: penicillin-binding protein activator LpoB [Lentisphaerales bacterium]|nr:penicillin-binding protein activator LpoB [Lentisphaerales bacterium]
MKYQILIILTVFLVLGCVHQNQKPAVLPQTVNADSEGIGIGITSKEIRAMTDEMMRDMLKNPILFPPGKVNLVIVDDAHFRNNSAQRIEKNLIVSRLRVELLRAAQGRMRFIGRHVSSVLEEEQELRKEVKRKKTVDFRLTGRFEDQRTRGADGTMTNYVQVLFEMIDLHAGEIVWTNMYSFKKKARESEVYQ